MNDALSAGVVSDDAGREPLADRNSRQDLRRRALESRNSYVLGELPGEHEGAEIDRALRQEEDDLTLGHAFRLLVVENLADNERIEALKAHLGGASPGYAIGLRQHLDAVRFGVFPRGPSMARQIAARMKKFKRRHEFSESTHAVLDRNVEALLEIVENAGFRESEQRRADEKERSLEERLKSSSGVYVFTYPHYLLHPTHLSAESEKHPDRTLLKVGFSNTSILDRINSETRGAGIPEPRRILRAYMLKDRRDQTLNEIEGRFHDLLDNAGHAGPKRGTTERQRGGKEWFYTSVEFLDSIASVMDLEKVEISPDEDEL